MKVNYWKAYALLVTGALVFVAGNQVQPADAGPTPHMTGAQQKLEGALAQLQKANGSFGTHKVRAIDATKLAIAETKAAIAFVDEPTPPRPQ
jgi:hypothetical protein